MINSASPFPETPGPSRQLCAPPSCGVSDEALHRRGYIYIYTPIKRFTPRRFPSTTRLPYFPTPSENGEEDGGRGAFRLPSTYSNILAPLRRGPPPPSPATPHAVSSVVARVAGGPCHPLDHQNTSVSPPAPPSTSHGRWSSFEGISLGSKPRKLCSLTSPLLSTDKFLILVCTSGSTGALQVKMAACKTLILFKAPREQHVAKLLRVIEEQMDMGKMVAYDTEDAQKLHHVYGPKPSTCKMTTSPGVLKASFSNNGGLTETKYGHAERIEFGFMSPKLDELVQIFRLSRLSREVFCLISVERNMAVQVIEQLMNVMNESSLFSILHMTGGSLLIDAPLSDGETKMPAIKDLFLSGKVNLFTTNVTEEVACIPSCSFFMLHELPILDCSYVQTSNQVQNEHSSYVRMPESESFHRLIGPVSMNCNRIQSVSLNVHHGQVGAVKGHALPSFEETWENDLVKRANEYYSGAGTTKRKELHGMTTLHALSGTWASQANDAILNAYEIKFICSQVSGNFSPFVLLIEARLDGDVANTEIELHLHLNTLVRSSVSPCGQIQLNAHQVAKSKLFHEFFFNGLFGKLFFHSRGPSEFLLGDENQILWSSSYMYMLLPMESPFPTGTGIVNINWKGIDTCISVVEFLRNIYSKNCHRSSLTCTTGSSETKYEATNIVHMANEAVGTQYLKGMVVLAVHTGRIYTVLNIMNDMCADSPFDEHRGKRSKFSSFSHYYHQKYNITLQHPGQPLLLVKQSHHPHNLLVSSTKYKVAGGSISSSERSSILVHIPPELLVHLNVSSDVLRSSYLLPSVMHRLESMMLACQLRQETCCIYNNQSISSSLILEAITTSRCSDNFSMERLEFLGDSVLKYVVSCHLFLKYSMKSEGQLSEYRSWIVSNSTLHKLGTHCHLQGYIRDCPFDPRRWVAPGQISLRPLPCTCGVNTSEVPLEKAYWSEEASIVIGKACDKGHRWICSKTIADCVEALIGAYYVGGGLGAALSLLRWLGMDVSPEPVMIKEVKMNSSLWLHHLRGNEIDWLESKLDYRFSNKGLLLEAITHPSHRGSGNKYCYQRLEFLGDSVLGLLITWYLFQTHVDLDPGELSELRSALICNDNFAQATVGHNLEKHLRHASEGLSKKIREYLKDISEFQGTVDSITSFAMPKAPKALGDLLESISGAVLIDSDLNLDRVWEVFKPLLSPMVAPDKLELPPLRELVEFCNHMGYPLHTQFTYKGEQVVAELSIQLEEDLLVRHGCNLQRKTAKAQAALQLLRDLETRGISHAQYSSKRRQQVDNLCSTSSVKISMPPNDMEIVRTNLQNLPEFLLSLEPSTGSFLPESCQLNDLVKEISTSKLNEPDVPVLSMKKEKGGPRNALFELCAISKWPMPKFESTEKMFRTPIVLDGVTGFNSYTSSITLHIPKSGAINLVGEPRADKKSSRDSAAFAMLVELQKQGRCIIKEP